MTEPEPAPIPEHWEADPELAQHLIATYGSLQAAAEQLITVTLAAVADHDPRLAPGWRYLGATQGGGRLYIAPLGTPPPDDAERVTDARALLSPDDPPEDP